jgi:hypothetical protein
MNFDPVVVRHAVPLLADAGIPMIFVTFPLMVCALIPVIVIEAMVAKPLLDARFGRSVWVLAVANVVSTLLGIPAAWVIVCVLELVFWGALAAVSSKLPDSAAFKVLTVILSAGWLGPMESDAYWAIPLAAIILLTPSFFLSWYIEAFVIDHMTDREWKVARATSFKANLASYSALFVCGCLWLAFSLAKHKVR